MSRLTAQVIVLAKEPRPGLVKTRLTPPFSPHEAARLAAAALADTLAAAGRARFARHVLALAVPPRSRDSQGAPAAGRPRWLPAGFELAGQQGSGLDERIAAALDDAYARLPVPAVLVGMDTPQLTPELLEAVARPLVRGDADAVFGPAQDGGFWLLGLRRPDPSLVLGVPMSVPHTGRVQLARLTQAGLRVSLMPELVDVDTVDDARLVASQAPDSRFAATLRGLDADASRLVSLGSAG